MVGAGYGSLSTGREIYIAGGRCALGRIVSSGGISRDALCARRPISRMEEDIGPGGTDENCV